MGNLESTISAELVPLRFSALATTGNRQHHEIEQLRGMRVRAFGQHGINNQQSSIVAPGQSFANIAQNLQRMIMISIMDDVLQVVSVSTRRDSFKEVAGHWLAAMIDPHFAQRALGAFHHVGQIQQYSLHARMSL